MGGGGKDKSQGRGGGGGRMLELAYPVETTYWDLLNLHEDNGSMTHCTCAKVTLVLCLLEALPQLVLIIGYQARFLNPFENEEITTAPFFSQAVSNTNSKSSLMR